MFLKLYYYLTRYWPRRMPRTDEDMKKLTQVLKKYYGLDDDPAKLSMIAGQIGAMPASSMRKSYGALVNSALRLDVNLAAYNLKREAQRDIDEKLKSLMVVPDDVREGTSDSQSNVSELPPTKETMGDGA